MAERDLREQLSMERLYFDGGTGSILQDMGLPAGASPELWNLTEPEKVIALHQAYLEAGCDIFNTNTFGANALKFPGQVEEIVRAALSCAKEARTRSGREDARIALDIGPTGRLLAPMGDLAFEDAVALFSEVVRAGADGADLVLIETMSDPGEAKAAVLAAKEACDLPVFVTLVFDQNGTMLTGGTPETATAILEGLGVDAIGINCSLGPAEMRPIASRILASASVPVIVNPNAGLPRVEDGRSVYDIDAEAFAAEMRKIASDGAHGIGGCCGTTPDYIRALIDATRDLPFVAPEQKSFVRIASISQHLDLDPSDTDAFFAPGDAEALSEAIADRDPDDIADAILTQEDDDAEILNIDLNLPADEDPALMADVVRAVQSLSMTPLRICSRHIASLEAGLRACSGRPLVRLVDGTEASVSQLSSLVEKYGAVLS